jgi:hypothetical protein
VIAIATLVLAASPSGTGAKPAQRAPSTAGLFGTTVWEPPTVEEFQRRAQSLYHATPEQQATRLRGTARLLLAHRRQLRLQRVDWHTWRDFTGGDNFWDKYMGLFTADGHLKPAWIALTQITGGIAGGPMANVGHKPLPPGPGPAPGGGGGGGSQPPPKPPTCLLPGILC